MPYESNFIYKHEDSKQPPIEHASRKPSIWLRKLKVGAYKVVRFLTSDTWHMQPDEVRGFRRLYINTLKALYVAIKGFIDQRLSSHASALTHRTLLSTAPMLAIIVALAKGLGLQGIIYDFLMTYMLGYQSEVEMIMGLVENYLGQVQGGFFLGVGSVFFPYTIFQLLDTVEQTFNVTWGVSHGHSIGRRLTDYVTIVVLLPILMTLSSGLTVMMATIQNTWFNDYIFFAPLWEFMLELFPYIIFIFMFAGIFTALPNMHVKFVPALISGVVTGSAFQVLQVLYASGILWIFRYNVIYGEFAAIPLLLLRLQMVRMITFFSAELCFSIQNVVSLTYVKDAADISHRYKDFMIVIVMTYIVQCLLDHTESKLHNVLPLSEACHSPINQTGEVIVQLLEEDLVIEAAYSSRDREQYYNLVVDPNLLTVGYLPDRMDHSGHRNHVFTQQQSTEEWQLVAASRHAFTGPPLTTRFSDLPLGRKL